MKNIRNYCAIAMSLACLSSCATQSAMPLGNDMMRIDVSAAPVYGRAGAQRMALETAASATLKAGYDKFLVVNNEGWNEAGIAGGSYGQANAYGGGFGSSFATQRHPESSLIIHMFHNGDKGSEKAVDARSILASK